MLEIALRFQPFKTMYENTTKIALKVHVEKNLNKNVLPYVCLALFDVSVFRFYSHLDALNPLQEHREKKITQGKHKIRHWFWHD